LALSLAYQSDFYSVAYSLSAYGGFLRKPQLDLDLKQLARIKMLLGMLELP
jgi:hypothetical protein